MRKLQLYRLLNEIKDEINVFTEIIKDNRYYQCNMEECEIRYIAKILMFLKRVLQNNFKNDYSKLMIYAIFQMLDNTVRNNMCDEKFNLYKRIYIENLFRYLLDVESTRTSIREMKEDLEKDIRIKNAIDYFYSNHRKASGIIHVNDIKDIKINEYFLNISQDNDKFDRVTFRRNIKDIVELLKKSIEIIIIRQHEIIGQAFYNQMEILEYLLGQRYYNMYTEHLY